MDFYVEKVEEQAKEFYLWLAMLLVPMNDLYAIDNDVHFRQFLRIPVKNDRRSNVKMNLSNDDDIWIVHSVI